MRKTSVAAICVLALFGSNRTFSQNEVKIPYLKITEGENSLSISSNPKKGDVTLSVGGVDLLISGTEEKSESKDKDDKTNKKWNKGYRAHLPFLSLGVLSLSGMDYSMYTPEQQNFMDLNMGRSIQFAMNIMQVSTPLTRNHSLGVSTALGMVADNYTFANDITFLSPDGMLVSAPIDASKKKSKLTTFAFRIPLMLNIDFAPDFSISMGVYGEMITNAHTKVKFPKEKSHWNSYVNPFQAGCCVNLGIKGIHFYGNYSLTPLFVKGKGPEATPFSVGIGFFGD